jgi:hypothetical protein
MRKANRPGPEADPLLPSLREIMGFLSPFCCALVGYSLGYSLGQEMVGFLFAMVGVAIGALIARVWAEDFYR